MSNLRDEHEPAVFDPTQFEGVFPELDIEKGLKELMATVAAVVVGLLLLALAVIIELLTHLFSNLARSIGSYVVTHQLETSVYSIFAVALIVSAVLLYRLRCRHRAIYGVGEVVFGVASILWAAQGLLDALTSHKPGPQLDAATMIGLIAGLYIVIRGLNNVEEAIGIKPGHILKGRFPYIWMRLFHAPLRAKRMTDKNA